jgi:hypothetical protein
MRRKSCILIFNILISNGFPNTIFVLNNQLEYIKNCENIFGIRMNADIKFLKIPKIYKYTKRAFFLIPSFNDFIKETYDYNIKVATAGLPTLLSDISYVQLNLKI